MMDWSFASESGFRHWRDWGGNIRLWICARERPLNRFGVLFEEGDGFATNEPELIQNLDLLPFPDYSCFDSIRTYKTGFPYNQYPVLTSRGMSIEVPVLRGTAAVARTVAWQIAREHHRRASKSKTAIPVEGLFLIVDDNFTGRH